MAGRVSQNPVEKLPEIYDWANMRVAEYNYRKRFGLSKRQMDEEPWEDFYINQIISRVYAEVEEAEIKKHKK